ncbi:LysR substrate-binding domain-containing protein [Pararhizobium mangrovi]|uniref:LysR family transcriptional regulator n=1 Tax=Pararhizobium mangrovi TaxID=2590452 RepID=A0A506UB03_9HYPH|nr:LysR substrate-binding domain-containing protein [Pararhizobium mangrovi]TPW30234.1 LysR family transcriptional regulator [Pararhizobium mangrovi]
MKRPYDLPSMTGLLCFEAAARNSSFKAAAVELNVTPAAISHQIKGLEAELARTLFRRQHRGVELTEIGAYLFVALQRGFQTLSNAVSDVRGQSESEDVTVQATTAISAFWLTPQIAAFWKSHPEILISQIVSDIDVPGSAYPDLSVHYGALPEDENDHHFLFRDRMRALGSPGYAAAHQIREPEDLLSAPLIHLSGVEAARWTGWTDWFRQLGHPAPTGKRIAVNNYMIALQLAQDGVGAVLGWDGLVMPQVEQGRLLDLVSQSIPSPHCYYLKVHPRASAKARVFADWLTSKRI